ncbi:MAG: MtrB/PioB family decaheme-associated outer membrane protein [Burkholderiales bacterium]|nr:MtrB/PioB family decaheme-associated outer membrane protein [Burkholderiales bacterium]
MGKIDRATRKLSVNPLAAAVALALAAPGAALAEPMLQVPLYRGADMSRYDENNVELGVGFSTESSFKFGEFNGIHDQGGFLIGNLNLRNRLGDDGRYLNAFGYNLGLPSRQLGVEYGKQGGYWISAGYDMLTRYQFSDTLFIHNGLGGSVLTLPAGFAGITAGTSQPPANAAAINPFLRTYEIKQDRDVFRLGGGFNFAPGWDLSVNYRQDDRDGSKLIGAVMGNTGGNPRAAILPYDLNDRTQQVEAVVRWRSKTAQANFSYWYSKYDNDVGSLTWQNPYGIIAGWAGNSGFNTGYGRLGLMPSNDFHQFAATGAWNLAPKQRLTGTFSYSMMRQDDAFLPYTINGPAFPGGPTQTPGTTLTVPNALPRSSLDGKIDNTLLDLAYFTRAWDKVTLRANYHYNKHNNKTPTALYAYVGGDTSNQPPVANDTINSTQLRWNVAESTTENRFKVDGDYEIFRRTLLRGFYEYKHISYEEESEALRSHTTNNLLGAELRRIMSEEFTGTLRYAHDQRTGSDYSLTRAYRATYTTGTTNAVPFPDNVPTLRHFFLADYDKDMIRAIGSITPMERVTIDLRADWYKVKYKGPDCGGPNDQVLAPANIFPAECLGRTQGDGASYTIDGSFVPADGWNAFAFYTYSLFSTDQLSRNINNTAAQQISAARDWSASLKYTDNTVGLGVRYQPDNKKYDVGAQYVFSDGTGKYGLGAASALVPGPLPVPDTQARLHSLQLFAKYRYSKNVALRFNYWFEKYRTDDWAYDNATPTSSNNVLLTGHQSPQYDAHIFGISIAYTNW